MKKQISSSGPHPLLGFPQTQALRGWRLLLVEELPDARGADATQIRILPTKTRSKHNVNLLAAKKNVVYWKDKQVDLFSHRKGYLIIKMHIFQTRKMGITPQQRQWDRRRNWVSNDLRKGDQHDSANRKQNWLKTTLIVALQPTAWGPALEVQGRQFKFSKLIQLNFGKRLIYRRHDIPPV